ncbi:MAG: glycine cleavage system protein GcvH [Phycisphaerales bacterium]|jgi:glycine cleavage system H protein|nr:glycine cleavage system protein H [Planctomycetaceae bacterium]MDP6157651.1 glycine cleavage system protein GcvH [Phycisphaerales bacterium]MDP7087220.1 glycine cleavage system protein GcvH [Phycisphaerales bacterium]MDP7189089.1 glycine cleavage system protein GcvH [Phycisphaerales bacterium]MDP7520409.1 glycine cleavage system protein GcvH [Phycisphaerales bacterium]|tara:strand:+ start:98 stop:478 length:381 start_codon:yes stop_codon:yes gene_type:complete
MPSPADCRYSDSHEWFRHEGDTVTMGITPHAASELTDITYVELRPTGTAIDAGDAVGEVESVKTTSDVYSVVAGEIVAINDAAVDDPALLNSDPQGVGWLVKVRTEDAAPLETLMDSIAYDEKYGA